MTVFIGTTEWYPVILMSDSAAEADELHALGYEDVELPADQVERVKAAMREFLACQDLMDAARERPSRVPPSKLLESGMEPDPGKSTTR